MNSDSTAPYILKDEEITKPDTLVFSGQLITLQNAPLTPVYQLNRELACSVQRNMAIIFESVQFSETVDSKNNTVRRRKISQDLYYLVQLRNAHNQDDIPAYYITAASPGTLGNIQFNISNADFQKKEFRAMLNADKSAADILLFNRDTQQLLFDIKPKWKNGQYQWIDASGVNIASESRKGEEHKLHINVPLQQQKRDAIVALWILRLWHEITESRVEQREESETVIEPVKP